MGPLVYVISERILYYIRTDRLRQQMKNLVDSHHSVYTLYVYTIFDNSFWDYSMYETIFMVFWHAEKLFRYFFCNLPDFTASSAPLRHY